MRVVDEEPDSFTAADGAKIFGDDVSVVLGVGDARVVVADQMGARLDTCYRHVYLGDQLQRSRVTTGA